MSRYVSLVIAVVASVFALAVLATTSARAEHGFASNYGRGDGYGGRRTASGERMNPNAMTAAHRTLRFGTRVRVVNKRSGRSVVVRINDRGPFVRGRVIDLSAGAARSLGCPGLCPVSLQVLR